MEAGYTLLADKAAKDAKVAEFKAEGDIVNDLSDKITILPAPITPQTGGIKGTNNAISTESSPF